MELPRQGLETEFAKFWLDTILMSQSKNPRKPLSYFSSSPGIGKTFFLREIMKKNDSDIPEDCKEWSKNIVFLGITFNSYTENEDILTPKECMYLRLIFMNLVDGTWENFLQAYIEFKVLFKSEFHIRNFFEKLLVAKYPNIKSFVILVDEILKVPNTIKVYENRTRADQVRSAICHLTEPKIFNNITFSSIFSSVDTLFIENETSTSRRRTQIILDIKLLDKNDTTKLLSEELKEYDLKKYIDGKWEVVKEDSQEREDYFKMLGSFASGHPRSIEYIIASIKDKNESVRDIVKFAAHMLFDSYEKQFKDYIYLYLIPVLMGTKMYYSDKINGQSINTLVRKGILIDSKTNNDSKTSLLVPELIFYKVLNSDLSYKTELVDLFELHFKKGPLIFEEVLVKWEILMRKLRPINEYENLNQKIYENISVFDYLKQPIVSDSQTEEILKNVRFNATSKLEIKSFGPKETITLEGDRIYVPSDVCNPGFDSIFSFDTISKDPVFLILFNENKISRDSSNNTLTIAEVVKKYELTERFVNDRVKNDIKGNFFLVFFARRKLDIEKTELPSKCIILNDDNLTDLFGKNLYQMFMNLSENDYIDYQISRKPN